MGAFEYTALDTTGRERKGVAEGDTARQVRQSLREPGMIPLQVEEVQKRVVDGTLRGNEEEIGLVERLRDDAAATRDADGSAKTDVGVGRQVEHHRPAFLFSQPAALVRLDERLLSRSRLR